MPLFRERSGKFSPEKTVALLATLAPVLWLGALALENQLGGRPVTEAIHFTGLWAVRFLLLSLAVTPLRRIFHWPKLVLARRTLGLAAFFYAAFHLALFAVDQGSVVTAAREIALRAYLTVGAVVVAVLLVLAATSFDGAIRRLGAHRWNALHATVYAAAPLAVLHFLIQSKLEVSEAVLMGGLLIFLMAYRIAHRLAGNVGLGLLAGLVALTAILTGAGEMGWYAVATRVNPQRVFWANFDVALRISPALWVLMLGAGLWGAAAMRQLVFPPRKAKGRPQPAPAPRATAA